MKRILLILALLFPTVVLSQQATVTGTLRSAGVPAVTKNTFVRFRLQNYVGQVPRVTATGVLVQVSFDVAPDSSGNISTTIYRNDFISPQGTYYRVEYWYQGVLQHSASYLVNAATFDLDTATPINPTNIVGPSQVITLSYLFQQGTSSSTWTITHNLADTNLLVEVFDLTGKMLWPDTITNTDANTTVITFVTPHTGRALLMHAGNVNIATNQPNALVSNPVGNQTTLFDLSANSFTSGSFNSASTGISQSGQIRLADPDSICWRNNAGNGDLCLAKGISDVFSLGGAPIPAANALTTWTATQTFSVPPTFTAASVPFTVTSTNVVTGLNADKLDGCDWAAPCALGSTTPNSGTFTTLSAALVASTSASAATAGFGRLASGDVINWRNNAGSANLSLGKNSSDQLTFNSNIIPTISGAVTSGHVATFNASGQIQDGGAGVVVKGANQTAICSTGNSSYNQCGPVTVTWPSSFADNNYFVACSGITPSDASNSPNNGRAYVQVLSHTSSSVSLEVVTTGASSITWTSIECVGVHN